MEAENKNINIKVIQSVWRRIKKGHIKVRDLLPKEDVKGGRGITGESEPITGGTGTTGTTAHRKKKEVTIYKIRPRGDGNGCNLISDVLRFGRLWFTGPNGIANAIKFAKHDGRSHDALIRVYDDASNVTETHEHKDDFKEW